MHPTVLEYMKYINNNFLILRVSILQLI